MSVVLCHQYGVSCFKSQKTFPNEGRTERTREDISFFQSIYLRALIRNIDRNSVFFNI